MHNFVEKTKKQQNIVRPFGGGLCMFVAVLKDVLSTKDKQFNEQTGIVFLFN